MSISKLARGIRVMLLVIVLLAVNAEASPFLDALFSAWGGYGRQGGYGYGQRGYGGSGRGVNDPAPRATGGRSYKEICKVHNVDAYAFPGKVPYPAAPVCPY